MRAVQPSLERRRNALGPLLADPGSSAILSDLDGTLAPIVDRPDQAAVGDRARGALERIAGRYALCAVVTGRPPDVARRIVGVDAIAYAGNHGFELLDPGAERAEPSAALAGHAAEVAEFFASAVATEELERAGVRIEDKGPIVALHWRGAGDEGEAERAAGRVAAAACDRGLIAHAGRKVLELRPAVEIDKGVAIEALLEAAPSVRRALYAGDDRTDLDGFRALGRLLAAGRLDAVVRVGVRSPEGPPELTEACDLEVDGTESLIDLLETLAG